MQLNVQYQRETGPNRINIKLGTSARAENTYSPIKVICDLNENNELLGVEILGIIQVAGVEVLSKIENSELSSNQTGIISYDKRSDAFYFKLMQCKSHRQLTCDGILELNKHGNLNGIEIEY